jgi:hypothetical protein
VQAIAASCTPPRTRLAGTVNAAESQQSSEHLHPRVITAPLCTITLTQICCVHAPLTAASSRQKRDARGTRMFRYLTFMSSPDDHQLHSENKLSQLSRMPSTGNDGSADRAWRHFGMAIRAARADLQLISSYWHLTMCNRMTTLPRQAQSYCAANACMAPHIAARDGNYILRAQRRNKTAFPRQA